MAKSIEDFKEELRQIREDLYQNADNTDIRLLASYLDRLIISVETLADNIESMEISMEELSTADESPLPIKETECVCPCCCEDTSPARKAKKKAKKKAAKPKKRRK